jgi:hypothetical protein
MADFQRAVYNFDPIFHMDGFSWLRYIGLPNRRCAVITR